MKSPIPGMDPYLEAHWVIPIVAAFHKDVALQLQPLLDACYRDGRYDRLNYRAEPSPRLGESDARWLDELLRAKGLR